MNLRSTTHLLAVLLAMGQAVFGEERTLIDDDRARDDRARMVETIIRDAMDDPRVSAKIMSGDFQAVRDAIRDVIRELPPEETPAGLVGPVIVFGPKDLDGADEETDYNELSARLQSIPEEVWQNYPTVLTPILTPEALKAANLPDSDERARALADVLSTLSRDLPEELANDYRIWDGRVEKANSPSITEGGTRRSLSLQDAFRVLPEEKQEALRDYEHLIENDDEWGLNAKAPHMTREEVLAMAALIARRDTHEEVMQRNARTNQRANEAAARGYYQSKSEAPTAFRLLGGIREYRAAVKVNADPFARAGAYGNYETLMKFEDRHGFPGPLAVSSEMAPRDTETYVGPYSGGIAKVFAESGFGAPLAVMAYPVDDVFFGDPNLTVAGRDAALSLVKHAGGGWATRVAVYDGQYLHVIEAGAKLEGAARERLVRLAWDIVGGAVGMDLSSRTLFPEQY